ncbi:sensor histidine kinase [Niabella drilacis]|uniref:sensor histidine kinase n=1 Tax=Niabella drilacis (strain DSM 25811 / CCM 8410 / CCUG 62505 / LMG 26954 / E90) TaxID=1285928 RepID=UPI001C40AD12|nr:histidine kinase [Niabella drilacis]
MNYIFNNLDNTNGLVNDRVTSIAQDKRGFIWIGTEKGLQRYDGVRFANTVDTGASVNAPLYVNIMAIDDDRNRVLYTAITQTKQWSYLANKTTVVSAADDWKKGVSENFTDQKGHQLQLQFYTKQKTTDNENTVQGIALIKAPGDQEPLFANFIQDRIHNETWALVADKCFFLFDHKRKKVYDSQYDPVGNTLKPFAGNHLFIPDGKYPLRAFRDWKLDTHGNIWIVSYSHFIFRYNLYARQLYRYDLKDIIKKCGGKVMPYISANNYLDDHQGNLWIATSYGGVLQYRFGDSSFALVTHWPGHHLSLQYNYDIFSLFQDREENIWIGSDKGISVFNPNRQYFTPLSNFSSQPQAAPETELTTAFRAKNGDLYTGNWGNGINIYDTLFHLKKKIFFNDIYAKNQVWCFLQDDEGNIWAGGQYGFLHIINPVTLSVRTLNPPEFEGKTIRTMVQDGNGNIAFGLHSGKVVVWHKQQRQFLPYRNERQPRSLTLRSVLALFVGPSGLCLVGTEDGLREFDIQKQCFEDTVYRLVPSNATFCNSIAPYNGDTVLVAMRYGGLYFFNTKLKTYTPLRARVANAPATAFAARTDNKRNIWFTSDYQLYKYAPAQNALSVFYPKIGVLNSAFSGELITTPSGEWITWTTTELVVFDPGKLPVDVAAQVTITGLKIFDRQVPVDSLLFAKKPVVFSYKENFITIEFSNLKFLSVTPTTYVYRLSGVDKNWVSAGEHAQASYTNLNPGTYRFEVRAGMGGNSTFIDIVINGPFWGTTWFKVLCFALLAVIGFVLVKWRINAIRREAHIKEQMAHSKVMALRAQMNPHFIFNCLNSIRLYAAKNDSQSATMYLTKFSRLIRLVLENSKNERVTLKQEMETIQLYIEMEIMRFKDKLQYEISIDPHIEQEYIELPPMMIQPFVENAIWHGLMHKEEGGMLYIMIRQSDDDFLTITIRDNGIGRIKATLLKSKSATTHKSYGMHITHERLEALNQKYGTHASVAIHDLYEDHIAAGTEVTITLPVT